jgi:hypothetical protein
MDRALLEKPFTPEVVKTRKGAFGELSYVEAAHYIRRLNDAFEGQWSWRIVSHQIEGSEVIVLGVLEAGGASKHAFGGSAITTNRTTGEVVSQADDLKAAATDALKKACSLFGIGLDLYTSSVEPAAVNPTAGSPRLRTVPSAPPARAEQPTAPPERNRLTAKQLRAIYAIGHAQGLSDAALKKRSLEAFGVAPEFLSRTDASALIESLSEV